MDPNQTALDLDRKALDQIAALLNGDWDAADALRLLCQLQDAVIDTGRPIHAGPEDAAPYEDSDDDRVTLLQRMGDVVRVRAVDSGAERTMRASYFDRGYVQKADPDTVRVAQGGAR